MSNHRISRSQSTGNVVPHATSPSSKRVKWLVVLAAIGLVAGPVGVRALPKEIVRWKIAAAAEARLNGDLARAEELLSDIVRSDPTDVSTISLRAAWRMDARDYSGANEDFSRVLELQPSAIRVHEIRSSVRLHLQRFDEAIEDADEVFAVYEKAEASRAEASWLEAWLDDWLRYFGIDQQLGRGYRLAHARNGRAYAKAVANRDLDAALVDINAAIDVVKPMAPAELPSLQDTRGFILYRLGEYQAALDEMNAAIAQLDHPLVDDWLEYARKNSRESPDPRQVRHRLLAKKETIAVLHYHRMLIHEALGNTAEANADRQRVVTLGFEPNDQLF